MERVKGAIWAAILLAFFAYILMMFVMAMLPLLIPIAAIFGVYCLMFKRPW
jgi:hypothetical protein